jgi:hypothetical protein
MALSGTLRNGSPQMANVFFGGNDVTPLIAFLNSLNEDYK